MDPETPQNGQNGQEDNRPSIPGHPNLKAGLAPYDVRQANLAREQAPGPYADDGEVWDDGITYRAPWRRKSTNFRLSACLADMVEGRSPAIMGRRYSAHEMALCEKLLSIAEHSEHEALRLGAMKLIWERLEGGTPRLKTVDIDVGEGEDTGVRLTVLHGRADVPLPIPGQGYEGGA